MTELLNDYEKLMNEKARIERRNKRCKLATYKVNEVGGYYKKDEIFVQVVGYPRYYISNYGRVISLTKTTKNPRLLKIQHKVNNYQYVQMTNDKDKKATNVYIQRASAEVFCPNIHKESNEPIDAHHLNHKEDDNRDENLLWVPRSLHRYCNDIGEFGMWRNKTAKHLHPLEIVEKTGLDLEDIILAKKKYEPIKKVKDWTIYDIKGHQIALKLLNQSEDK